MRSCRRPSISVPTQITEKLKLADELRAAGKPIHEMSRVLGITDSTLYNWRKRYLGGARRQGCADRGAAR